MDSMHWLETVRWSDYTPLMAIGVLMAIVGIMFGLKRHRAIGMFFGFTGVGIAIVALVFRIETPGELWTTIDTLLNGQ